MNLSKLSHIEILKLAKACLGLLFISFTSAQASALQCQDLFKAASSNSSYSSSDIEALAELFLRIEAKDFLTEDSYRQSIDNLNKRLDILQKQNPSAVQQFKQLVNKKRSEFEDNRQQENTERESIKKNRQTITQKSDGTYYRQNIVFHEIQSGKFKMGPKRNRKVIEDSFFLMATPMTQLMWAKLKIAMGEKDIDKMTPSEFKTGPESKIVKIAGFNLQMKPDHPVEQVSLNDVIEFIEGLNRLSATDDVATQKLLQQIIPDHQLGDVYDLPSSPQWEFVMTNRGQAQKDYFNSNNEKQITKYAWLEENSDKQTQAVATLKPRMIDGKPFFDLEGNVWEWTKDTYSDSVKAAKRKKIDPDMLYYITRGHSWYDEARSATRYESSSERAKTPTNDLGFRLAKTRAQAQ